MRWICKLQVDTLRWILALPIQGKLRCALCIAVSAYMHWV